VNLYYSLGRLTSPVSRRSHPLALPCSRLALCDRYQGIRGVDRGFRARGVLGLLENCSEQLPARCMTCVQQANLAASRLFWEKSQAPGRSFRGLPLPITALIALLHSLSTLGQMPASLNRFGTNLCLRSLQFGNTSRNQNATAFRRETARIIKSGPATGFTTTAMTRLQETFLDSERLKKREYH
jgi:hypothetical protein